MGHNIGEIVKIFLDSITPELSKQLVFLGRVIPEMEKLGCVFQFEPENADVILVCNKNDFKYRKSSLPKAIRPVHIHVIDKPSTVTSNKNRLDMCESADLVVWQCNWLKDKYRKLLGYKAKNETVIYNAIDPAYFSDVRPMKSPYKKNVVMLAAWSINEIDRPRKRLGEMLNIAHTYVKNNEDVCFWVIGDTNGITRKHDRIKMMGKIPFKDVAPILLGSNAMLNLTWFDNCPNAVIEALVAGIPVICNNETGAVELVKKDGGIIVPIDATVKKYVRGRDAPSFDKEPVMEALTKVLTGWPEFDRPELHIRYAAQKYYDALKGLLK